MAIYQCLYNTYNIYIKKLSEKWGGFSSAHHFPEGREQKKPSTPSNVILLQRKQFVLALCTVCPVIALCPQVITPSSLSPWVKSKAVVSQSKAPPYVHIFDDWWGTFVRLNRKKEDQEKLGEQLEQRCGNTCWKKSQPILSILIGIVLLVVCKHNISAFVHPSLWFLIVTNKWAISVTDPTEYLVVPQIWSDSPNSKTLYSATKMCKNNLDSLPLSCFCTITVYWWTFKHKTKSLHNVLFRISKYVSNSLLKLLNILAVVQYFRIFFF